MAKNNNSSWKFPNKNILFIKIESFMLSFLTFFVFVFSYFQYDQRFFPAIVVTILFLGVYTLISIIFRKIRFIEEHYSLTKDYLEIKRKINKTKTSEKVKLKDVIHYKLDKFFLGAYILTKKRKHIVYFNNLKELESLEKHLKKNSKKKR